MGVPWLFQRFIGRLKEISENRRSQAVLKNKAPPRRSVLRNWESSVPGFCRQKKSGKIPATRKMPEFNARRIDRNYLILFRKIGRRWKMERQLRCLAFGVCRRATRSSV